MLELYKNIKDRRLALNLTQSELAKKMGYADKSMIAKIEKGSVDLQHSKIVAFANALGVKPSELMGWKELPAVVPASGPSLSSDEQGLIDTYRQLTDENQGKVSTYANSLLGAQEGDEILRAIEAQKEKIS